MNLTTPAPVEPIPLTTAPPADAKRRVPRWVIALLFGAAAAGATGFAVGRAVPEHAPAKKQEAEAKSPSETGQVDLPKARWAAAGIKLEPASQGPLVDRAWRTGTVQFDHDRVIHVLCPVEGIIQTAPAEHGQNVTAGQVLAVVKSREVGQAKLQWMNAKLARDVVAAQRDWMRKVTGNATELWKALEAGKSITAIEAQLQGRPAGEWRDKLIVPYSKVIQFKAAYDAIVAADGGAVSPATLRKARSDYETAQSQYRAVYEEARYQIEQQRLAAEQKFREAQAAADTAEAHLLMIGYTKRELAAMDPAKEGADVSLYRVRAPFAGTVVEKHAVLGERVVPQHQLFYVADLSQVWIRSDVFEADLPLLRGLEGKGVVFRAPTAGLAERPAAIEWVGSVIDPASRALPLVADATNADRALKPGMFVEVGLPRGTTTAVLHVPAAAVQRHENRTFVFVPHDDGFRRVFVAVGTTVGGQTEITAGLQPGEQVVTDGAFVLKTELLKDSIAGE